MVSPQGSMNMTDSTPKRRFSRRDFLKVAGLLGLNTVLLGAGGIKYVTGVEPGWIEISDVRLTLPRLPRSFSGFRMVQVSDIHIGPWMSMESVRSIFELALEQAPDMLALTGDYVLTFGGHRGSEGGMYAQELDEFAVLLKDVNERCLTVAVQGNHDYYYDTYAVQAAFRRGGATLLKNSVHTLERNGERLHIGGLDDVYEHRDDFDALLAQLPDDGCSILLAHEPDFADISAATGRFDLQISGHSHGGQVILPFVGPPVLPDWGKKYPLGLYQVEQMYQYTNRGVGTSIPAVRFNCRPEITVFTLESA
jgi:uncharacterized protein